MSELGRALKGMGVVTGVVLAGVLLGWLGSRGPVDNGVPSATPETRPEAAPTVATAPAASSASANSAPSSAPRLEVAKATPSAATASSAGGLTNWQDGVEGILTSDVPEAEKSRQLLKLFPNLPEDGQVEVAQHLSNMMSDADYPALGQYLTNAALPESVQDVLMNGLLTRPNTLKLPLLLDIAQADQHPKAPEAQQMLQAVLEANYGKDWNQWQNKVNQYIQDNPE